MLASDPGNAVEAFKVSSSRRSALESGPLVLSHRKCL
jgi:hypothetical protein